MFSVSWSWQRPVCTCSRPADTHTHADHRTGVPAVRLLTGAKAVMHKRSPTPRADVHIDNGDVLPLEGHEIKARGRFSLHETLICVLVSKVMSTPGHTPDSMSLFVPTKPGALAFVRRTAILIVCRTRRIRCAAPHVLTGDALLIHGSGRTDFAGAVDGSRCPGP